MPTETEVRRFFQEAYYSRPTYEPETGKTKTKFGDKSSFVYPNTKGASN